MTDIAPPAATRPERRQDLARRVRFECDMRGVPLHLEVKRGSYARRLKPAFDGAVALAALIALSPLLVIVAIAIKLDDGGPVLFIQNRTGYLGQRFRLFKFRTMVVDAEALKAKLRAHNVHAADSPDFKLADDPRVTRLGRFLRKTSIDELPNLWNVVRGEMALVGPRPTSFDASTYRMPHLPRLAVRPGLTGLWQVSGRANIDFDERSELDVRYIKGLSAKQDLELIMRTINAVKKGDGAC
ncbi:sugar transferase [Sphingomonas jeddahensis]|uniref:UDP-N-acetylgalactosamine-undecaprenyl-phosphate N-acetylgalactosaminephosphotransferase n=1 Tax=Sphingomonas jeddahensis TaxID=1915074 RepID=A0A1V2ETW1_9SPHN|nr:sugar transferase [Sphingomonas jeddahensis]ONF96101.1 UDP-N-acetylgalactosamine-undecaprenyl-phosphate N-acetylgalactosaminephosphotransferase [Sphingomonas jeddahensis]